MKGPASAKLASLGRKGELLTTTLFAAGELYAGVSRAAEARTNMEHVDNILAVLNILPFDLSTAKLFGYIYSELRRQGVEIGVIDTLIASVVLENDETLITRNVRHFSRVPNLRFESY